MQDMQQTMMVLRASLQELQQTLDAAPGVQEDVKVATRQVVQNSIQAGTQVQNELSSLRHGQNNVEQTLKVTGWFLTGTSLGLLTDLAFARPFDLSEPLWWHVTAFVFVRALPSLFISHFFFYFSWWKVILQEMLHAHSPSTTG